MTKFIKSYRNVILDLDYALTLDNRMGYKVLTTMVTFWAGMVTYAVLLDTGVIV